MTSTGLALIPEGSALRPSRSIMTRGIARVAANALRHFEKVLHPQAIRIFTPFTKPVPLSCCQLTTDLERFLVAYEPKVQTNGLFPHQADFLRAYNQGARRNF